MPECKTSCPKIKREPGSSPGPKPQAASSYIEDSNGISKHVRKSAILNRRSPSQSQKSVQIGGVIAVETSDSQGTRSSEETIDYTERDQIKDSPIITSPRNSAKISPPIQIEERNEAASTKNAASVSSRSHDKTESNSATTTSVNRTESPRKIEQSVKHDKMSPTSRSPRKETNDPEWNSNGHDPCPPSCPMTRARELATRRAELRQEMLDDYLLNKGFRYFDDLCTCSSICLINQLRRDKFVVNMLKSVCLFIIGMKLCDELDALNIIG